MIWMCENTRNSLSLTHHQYHHTQTQLFSPHSRHHASPTHISAFSRLSIILWACFPIFFIHIYHILLVQSNHSVEMCWCFFLFDLVTSFVDVLFEIVSMIEVSHLTNGILLTPMGLVNKTASPFLSFFPVDGSQCMQFDQKPTDRQLPMCFVSSEFIFSSSAIYICVFRQIESRDILSSVHELFPR